MTDSVSPILRKAVIPAAGYGTRLFPATKAVKKELFPIIDRQGRAKPLILAIVEEALSGGIESVGIVVRPEDLPSFEAFFHSPLPQNYLVKVAAREGDYLKYLQQLGDRVSFILQEKAEGFGHAVYCAREWVNGEPFLVLLGDHIYLSDTTDSCSAQVCRAFQHVGQSVIGIEPTPAATIAERGCVVGDWETTGQLLKVTGLYEKPEAEYARQHYQIKGLQPDQLLAIFGLYALSPHIFDHLEVEICGNQRLFGEFQLTSALHALCQREGMMGYQVEGRSLDTGRPQTYLEALRAFGGIPNQAKNS